MGHPTMQIPTCHQNLQEPSNIPGSTETPSRPLFTCTAVAAGSSSGAAPGTRPHPASAPGATGPARRLRSLCPAACRRPACIRPHLSRPLLRAVAVAVAGLDLAPPESPLRPESHNTSRIGARPQELSPAPAQAHASGCACAVVRFPAGAGPRVHTYGQSWLSPTVLLSRTRKILSQTFSQLL